jgi:hypothetical protein
MAYIYQSEYNSEQRTAQVYKISGVNEWAVKQFENSSPHPVSEQKFSSELDAETFAQSWVDDLEYVFESDDGSTILFELDQDEESDDSTD